jgi:hypothetical protein
MGQEEGQFDYIDNRAEIISRNLFDFQYVIGKGGFGKVNNNIYIIQIKIGLESKL